MKHGLWCSAALSAAVRVRCGEEYTNEVSSGRCCFHCWPCCDGVFVLVDSFCAFGQCSSWVVLQSIAIIYEIVNCKFIHPKANVANEEQFVVCMYVSEPPIDTRCLEPRVLLHAVQLQI